MTEAEAAGISPMSMSLLVTKTRLPPLQNGYVPRQRLLDAMEANPQARLVLLSAPAGYGKSSLLVGWCHRLLARSVGVIWYALDDRDNDPARFVAHLTHACRQTLPKTDGQFPHEPSADIDACVASIINAITGCDGQFVLVFDDYHLITDGAVHQALGLLLEHMPENLRLVIGSRANPPLQLSRLRARDQLVELRTADLRFTNAEVGDLYRAVLPLTLSQESINRLEATSEGWAAALRLLALTLNQASGGGSDAAVQAALERFSAGQHHLFDYFAQEVFDWQTPEIQEFLLDTCVLHRFEPHICAAVTGSESAPRLLDQLVRAGLFLISLSDEVPVYRYHHLFADFLQRRLQLHDPARYQARHLRAAEWHAAFDSIIEAVNHALAAGDEPYAAHLIETQAWERLTASGEIATILSWMVTFSEATLRQHPRLCLYYSRALYLTGDTARAAQYVELADEILMQTAEQSAELRALRAITDTYRATLHAYQGNLEAAQTAINSASLRRALLEPLAQARLVNTVGYICYLKGSVPAAVSAYEEASDLARLAGHHYLTADAEYYLAQLDLMAGRLSPARTRCEALLAQYPAHTAPLAAVMIPLARVVYEQNDVVRAETLLRDAIQLARRAKMPDTLWSASVTLAIGLAVQGRGLEAQTQLQQAQSAINQFHSPVIQSLIGAAQAQVLLALGRFDEAADWAEAFRQSAETDFRRSYEQLVLARVLLAGGHPEDALAVLERVLVEARADGRGGQVIEAEALRALAQSALSRTNSALESLERALAAARLEGYVRTFLDQGTPMLRLLRDAVARGVARDDAGRLLEIAGDSRRAAHPSTRLSAREIEVLALLANGATNKDVADHLVLSLGTVKSHINHLMTKLDARNRTEAVAKARSLGVLKDQETF